METVVARYSRWRTGVLVAFLAFVVWMAASLDLSTIWPPTRADAEGSWSLSLAVPIAAVAWLIAAIYCSGALRQILTRQGAAVWGEGHVLYWGGRGQSLPMNEIVGVETLGKRAGPRGPAMVSVVLKLRSGKVRSIDATLFDEEADHVCDAIRNLVEP